MQIKVQNHGSEGGDATITVEIIDPSDGAVTHKAELHFDDQIVVTATSAHSPADIEFGEVEAIPSDEPEQVDTGEEFEDGGETAEQAAADTLGDKDERVEDDGEAEQGA